MLRKEQVVLFAQVVVDLQWFIIISLRSFCTLVLCCGAGERTTGGTVIGLALEHMRGCGFCVLVV